MSNVNVLYNRSMYGCDKNNIINDITSYPCIYSITQKEGISLKYSKILKGHFGIPKVIWSDGAGTYPIIDNKGEYGLTQFAYAIVDKKNKLKKIRDAMVNKDFLDLMTYTCFKKQEKYNYKIIGLFRKDFYNVILNVQC